jgi:hypothetical protein
MSNPLPTAVQWSHLVLSRELKPGDVVVDATMGNGHDTLFLAKAVASGGHVHAFDVQQAALSATKTRLVASEVTEASFTLYHSGHEQLGEYLPASLKGHLAACMFNLGYLPGAEKALITKVESTLFAVQQALEWLAEGGLLTVVVYPGHQGGDEEGQALQEWIEALSPDEFEAQRIGFINYRPTTPFLVVVRKRKWTKR